MERYKDLDKDSGVTHYEVGVDSITVKFKDGAKYIYTSSSCGSSNIAELIRLAKIGDGLHSYIMRKCRSCGKRL